MNISTKIKHHKKVIGILAGGGTGGHVYPGLAVARELQSQWPELEIVFVGSNHGLENQIVPKAGYKLLTLPVGGLLRMGRVQQLRTVMALPFCIIKSLWILLKHRPQFVMGIGGFAAGPIVLVSSFIHRHTFIWEPNAIPGVTNRILSRFVNTAFVVFESARKQLNSKEVVVAGLPIRTDIQYRERAPAEKLRVLVFGGSQGARAINHAVADAWLKSPEVRRNVELCHQTGKLDHAIMVEKYKGQDVQCVAFIDNMSKALNWADLVISRGGVGSISEIIASRKASIIVPLPTAAENHQEANARYLVDKSAGEMVLQKDFSSDKVVSLLLDYKSSPQKIRHIEESLKSLQRPNGAKQIADFILKRVIQEKD